MFFSTSVLYQVYHRHKVYESLINESFLFDDDVSNKKKKKKNQNWSILEQSKQGKKLKKNPLIEMYDHKVEYSFFEYLKTDLA